MSDYMLKQAILAWVIQGQGQATRWALSLVVKMCTSHIGAPAFILGSSAWLLLPAKAADPGRKRWWLPPMLETSGEFPALSPGFSPNSELLWLFREWISSWEHSLCPSHWASALSNNFLFLFLRSMLWWALKFLTSISCPTFHLRMVTHIGW